MIFYLTCILRGLDVHFEDFQVSWWSLGSEKSNFYLRFSLGFLLRLNRSPGLWRRLRCKSCRRGSVTSRGGHEMTRICNQLGWAAVCLTRIVDTHMTVAPNIVPSRRLMSSLTVRLVFSSPACPTVLTLPNNRVTSFFWVNNWFVDNPKFPVKGKHVISLPCQTRLW